MQKRGTAPLADQLFILFDLIIVVIVGAVLFNTVNTLTSNSLVQQQATAADIALYLDMLYAAPGPMLGMLPETEYSITAEQGDYNKILVKKPGSDIAGEYLFHPDALFTLTLNQRLIKQGNAITDIVTFNGGIATPKPSVPAEVNIIHVYAADNAAQVQQLMSVGVKMPLDALNANQDLALMLQATDVPTLKLYIPLYSTASRYLAALIQQQLPALPSSIIPLSPGFTTFMPTPAVRAVFPRTAHAQTLATAFDTALQQYRATPVSSTPNVEQIDGIRIIARGAQ